MAWLFTNAIYPSLANPQDRFGNRNRLQARSSHNLEGKRSPSTIACDATNPQQEPPQGNKRWQACITAVLATAVVRSGMSAQADLNKYEAEVRGEFGIGSAAQFGSADLKKAVHINENFRRANFTAADMRESNFSGSTFNGAYLEKAVAYKADFTGNIFISWPSFLLNATWNRLMKNFVQFC